MLPRDAAMNRLILWVYRHPAAIVAAVAAVVLPVSAGLVRLSYETNYINLFRPETRVVRDYHAVESRLGGIGVVEGSLMGVSELGSDERDRLVRSGLVSSQRMKAQMLSPSTST